MSDFRWEGIHRNEFRSHRALAQLDGVHRSVGRVARQGYQAAERAQAAHRDTGATVITIEEGDSTDYYVWMEDTSNTKSGDNRYAAVNSVNLISGAVQAMLDGMGYR